MTYFSMYAFRKPFSAGLYEGISYLGVDYKILLVTTQLLGYAIAKVVGIKFISELSHDKRHIQLLVLIGISWLALLAFALIPPPYNFFIMFFNGLPLGLIWGIVFSYLEGRRFTEILAALLSVSFIVSSGIVKTIGRLLIDNLDVSEFWMPFYTGLIFIPFLFLGVWMLTKIPEQSRKDIEQRSVRDAMTPGNRKKFIKTFLPGIIFTALIYLVLTVFRDIRDNFAVDIWKFLGYLDKPSLLSTSETVIAIIVLIFAASLYKIKNNKTAFYANLIILPLSALLIMGSLVLFSLELIHPILWMILVGLGMYLPYITYHTMLLERWIASYKIKGNVGFLMYIMDSVGYITTLAIMIMKNYFNPNMSWGNFFIGVSWVTCISMAIFGILSYFYFKNKSVEFVIKKG